MRVLRALFIALLIGSACWAEVTITSDITRLGVGARPLGMGKTFTGLADDISALYANPAGLGGLKNPEVLSMSGTFANLANYITLAGTLPTRFGTVGVGYSGMGLGFESPVLNLVEIATGEYRVLPSTTESVSYNYNSYVLAFGYGTPLFRPDLSVGATLKLFTESISGSTSLNAKGYDMNIGVLFQPNPVLSLGALARNVIPASMGGKVTWSSGLTDTLPVSYVAGANLKLNLVRDAGDLNLCADYEYKPSQSSLPGFWHAGVEWWPLKLFGLRGGIDQDVVGKGNGAELETSNNFTAGMSIDLSGLRFDYAYHQYNQIPQNDTHYFSIVYAYQAPPRAPLELTEPKDKTITNKNKIVVKGTVRDPSITVVKVNRMVVPLSGKQRSFEAEVALGIGKNTISITTIDTKGATLESRQIRTLRLAAFSDVDEHYWAREPIEELATIGILSGYPDGKFYPDQTLKRAHLLLKIMELARLSTAEPTSLPFTDVGQSQPLAPYLQAGYNRRLVQGYPDHTFQPSKTANFLEGVLMTVRYSNFSPSAVLERPYFDISSRHWGIKEISAAKEKGMLDFVGANFNPQKEFTRAEFAAVLSKAPSVQKQVKELLDFEQGYVLK